jgi:hypothetical protein
VRANFFRGQAHTHRWLGWSCSPYIRLLEDSTEQSRIGLTEAVRYTRAQKGRWKNWPDLTFYVLADLLVREGLGRYVAPALPDCPSEVSVTRGSGAEISWAVVPNAKEYRIYRANAAGGPYTWLNSPYTTTPKVSLATTHFVDPKTGDYAEYVVTAVDAAGRESRWPENATRLPDVVSK